MPNSIFNTGSSSADTVGLADGKVTLPAINFQDDTKTGLYSVSNGVLNAASSGSEVGRFDSYGIKTIAGTVANPSYSFIADTDTGMYRHSSDTLAFATLGTERLRLSSVGTVSKVPFLSGMSNSVPQYSFESDADSGFSGDLSGTCYVVSDGKQAASFGTTQVTFSTSNTQRMSIQSTGVTITSIPILAADGLVSAPSYSFSNSTGSGLYYTGTANTIALATNGTARLTANTASLTSTLPFLGSAGSVSAPSLSFSGDPDTGLYNSTANTIVVATNGVARITTNTASITTTLPFVATGGSYSTPTYGFASNLGIYSPSANTVEVASSTAGNGSDAYLARFSATSGWQQIRTTVGGLTKPNNFIDQQYYGGDLTGGYNMFSLGDAYTSTGTAWNHIYCWNSGGASFRVQGNGNTYADGVYSSAGADYAEYFESTDGKEIPVGSTVVLDNGKVRKAIITDALTTIIGVVRHKNTSDIVTIGNTFEDYWSGKFEKDVWGCATTESFTGYTWSEVDEKTGESKVVSHHSDRIPNGVVVPENKTSTTGSRKKWSASFDPNAAYVPRSQRPEWLVIGLLGQIPVKNGEIVNSNWVLMGNIGDGTVAKKYLVR